MIGQQHDSTIRYFTNIMIKLDLEIINKLGLHARASSKLTQTASQFNSEIWIEKNGRRVNAKSIMGVMMLAAGKGSFIGLEANGTDEVEAVSALQALINNYFGEGE
jgi:phosphocarrier protein HPr